MNCEFFQSVLDSKIISQQIARKQIKVIIIENDNLEYKLEIYGENYDEIDLGSAD